MAFLVADGGHRQELAKPSNLIGSQPGAEIQLLPSLGIAPQHYRIERSEAGWQIAPVAEAGVTTLNGTPITVPSPLRHGDRIGAGQLLLIFEDLSPELAATSPPAPKPTPPPQAAPAAPAPDAAATPPPLPESPPPVPVSTMPVPLGDSNRQARRSAARSKRMPVMIAASLTLIGGGAFTAWKMGMFNPADDNSSDAHAQAVLNGKPLTLGEKPIVADPGSHTGDSSGGNGMGDQRNAQELASVFAAAMAAGTDAFRGVSDARTAGLILIDGVSGGEGTEFGTVQFKVSIDRSQLEGALKHLSWHEQDMMLDYTPGVGAASVSVAAQDTGPQDDGEATARRNAQMIASVYASAMVAGSEELKAASDTFSAIKLIAGGVRGSRAGFEAKLFSIPDLDEADYLAAAEYLTWSEDAKLLIYKD